MEADQHIDDVAEDQELAPEVAAQPESQPERKFVLTPRMEAIAKGEDPDAVVTEPEVAEAEPAEEAEAPEPEQADATTSEPVSWVTDADRNRAIAYGLDPEDLDGYASREEFGKVVRALDKAASRWEPQEESARRALLGTEPVAAEAPVNDTDPVVGGKINLAYYEKNNFDEGTVAAMRALRAQQDAFAEQSSQLEQDRLRQQQDEVQRQLNAFHQAVDQHRPDFFGSTTDKSGLPVELSGESHSRRARLMRAAQLVSADILSEQEAAGLRPSLPPYAAIIRQAEQLAFGEELAKHTEQLKQKERAEQLKKVAAQSQRRRGVGTGASVHAAYRNAPAEDPHSTESIMRHPAVSAVLRRFSDAGATN